MPFGNGMGPNGAGPMTGRGAGYCAGYGAPGYVNRPGGVGRGGFGGRGFRNRFFGAAGPVMGPAYGPANYGAAPYYGEANPAAEKEGLALRANALEAELGNLKKRLAELEEGSKE